MAKARHSDPKTSHVAAANVEAAGIDTTQKGRCFAALTAKPNGLTAKEIADMTGLNQWQVCRRLPELRELNRAHNRGDEERNGEQLWFPGPKPSGPVVQREMSFGETETANGAGEPAGREPEAACQV